MTFDELKFKAEDFYGSTGMLHAPEAAAEANRILAEKLERAQLIVTDENRLWFEREKPTIWDTYKARLVCIEQLKGQQ